MKQTKGLLSALLAAMLVLSLLPATALAAEGDTGADGDYAWQERSDGTVAITAYSGTVSGALDIPGTLSGKTVSAISTQAFRGKSMTSVTIPASVKTIGIGAFFQCASLNAVAFAADGSLETIGAAAFRGTALTSVTIPASVITIDDSAFFQCTSLNAVTFAAGGSLETIGEYAFSRTALTGVDIPASVITIGSLAFDQCTSLNTVTFAADGSLVTIGDQSFCGTALTSVTIPASVITIGGFAFALCVNLNTVTFAADGNLETIGISAFADTALTSVTIPASVKTIEECAFSGCVSLDTVTFAADGSLETIGIYAFYNTALTSVTIPASVTDIFEGAFEASLLDKAVILNDAVILGPGVFTSAPMTDGIYGFDGSTAQGYAAANAIPFHILRKVSFDSKGGSDVPWAYNAQGTTVDAPDMPTLSGKAFAGWYDNEDYVGDPVSFPYTVADDVTLYAKWVTLSLESSDADGTIYTSGRITLTPNIEGGEWDWDEEYFSATFNSPATFTALKAGASTITYTAGGVSVTYDVTILESSLPDTGQNFTWVWMVVVGAALMLSTGLMFRRRAVCG